MSTSLNPLAGQANSIIAENAEELEIISDHIHGVAKVCPTLSAGSGVVSNGSAWTLGVYTEIIPAGVVGDIFDIHYVNVEGVTADGIYELVLYAETVEIARLRTQQEAGPPAQVLASIPVITPLMASGTQVQAKVADSVGGGTLTISLGYHTY